MYIRPLSLGERGNMHRVKAVLSPYKNRPAVYIDWTVALVRLFHQAIGKHEIQTQVPGIEGIYLGDFLDAFQTV